MPLQHRKLQHGKLLGVLGGMSWTSTAEYYRLLNTSYTGLNSIPPIREKHPNGLHAVQTRIFSYSLRSEK